jgi:hypothetical protein
LADSGWHSSRIIKTIQEYKSSRVQEFKSSRVQEFKSSKSTYASSLGGFESGSPEEGRGFEIEEL